MKEGKFRKRQKIAIFDKRRKLAGIIDGVNQVSLLFGVSHTAISKALKGTTITINGFYIRPIPSKVILEQDDIGQLDLLDYDLDVLQEDRLIFFYTSKKKMYHGNTILESEYRKYKNKTKQNENSNN